MGGNSAKPRQPVRLVILGLHYAGKTSVLNYLKIKEKQFTMPTVGANEEEIIGRLGEAKDVKFVVKDVGGQENFRRLWKSDGEPVDGVVFVVDSFDNDNTLPRAKEELFRIAGDVTHSVPFLVIANKQDLPRALEPSDISALLDLKQVARGRQVRFCAASANTGMGLDEALQNMYQMILRNDEHAKMELE